MRNGNIVELLNSLKLKDKSAFNACGVEQTEIYTLDPHEYG